MRLRNGSAPEVASYEDLGAFQLLLSLQDDDALSSYCRSVLGPVEQGEGDYGDELVRSLDVFIEHNGHWEKAASRAVLPPPHAALPHPPRRAAHRARLLQRARPDRVLAGAAGKGAGAMRIGVPSEIKSDEYRVAITPAGVRELTSRGHEVLMQAGAGDGSAMSDEQFAAQGAHDRRPTPTRCSPSAELILKVKEPQPEEVALLRPEHTLFTYLHLAAEPELARGLMASGATCIAYETVEDAAGRLPLLAPMSEVAGKIATQAGAFMLEKPLGGRGILLGGVPGVAAATVLVIGGGVVGMNAAFIAIGMEADVFVFDRSIDRLRELEWRSAGAPRPSTPRRWRSNRCCPPADLVIGAVLIHGGRAPHVDHARAAEADEAQRGARGRLDRPGRLLRDVASDDALGPDLRGRRHHALLRDEHARRRADHLDLRAHERDAALRDRARRARRATRRSQENPGLRKGLNVSEGEIMHPAVAEALGLPVARVSGSAAHPAQDNHPDSTRGRDMSSYAVSTRPPTRSSRSTRRSPTPSSRPRSAAPTSAYRAWSAGSTVAERAALVRQGRPAPHRAQPGARRDHRPRDGQADRAGGRRGRVRAARSTSSTPRTPRA